MTDRGNEARRNYSTLMRKILNADGNTEGLCKVLSDEFKSDFAVLLNSRHESLGSQGKELLRKKPGFYRNVIPKKPFIFTPKALEERSILDNISTASEVKDISVAAFSLIDSQGVFGYLYMERDAVSNACFDEKTAEYVSQILASIAPALGFQLFSNPRFNPVPRNFYGMIGHSRKIQNVIREIQVYALFDEPVLIQGATGTGKELAANAIHQISVRREKPFFPVNCAVFTESLAESILMGHKRSTFTGAVQDKPGVFEMAEGGTVFLDEIGDLSPAIQAMLLRVLQEKRVRRLGDSKERKVDFRLICATNLNLQELMKQGKFRQDLYYRISALQIDIPPLCERKEDIIPFAEDRLRDFIRQYELDINGSLFTPAAKKKLESHPWKGNFRELVNVIQHSAALAPSGKTLDAENILLYSEVEDSLNSRLSIPCFLRGDNLDDLIGKIVSLELQNNDGKKIETARKLGISLHYLNQILAGNSVFKGNQNNK